MYFRLFTLLQKKTNCYLLIHHSWNMLQHYLVKCTNFSSFFIFSPVSSTNSLYGRVAERQRLVATWAEFQQSVVDDTVDQWQKDGKHVSVQNLVILNICCRLMLLAWHSICRTPQPVLFRAANANPQPAHSRATNVWRNAHTFSQMKMLCILQGSGVTFFRCGG